MSFEEDIRKTASFLQKNTAKKMTPITLAFAAGIVVYITVVLQGLQPPEPMTDVPAFAKDWAVFWFLVMLRVFVLFLIFGMGINTLLFEIWSSARNREVARILAWEGDYATMSQEDALKSLLALLDFPHRFVLRFIAQWLIFAPALVFSLRLFYSLPLLNLLRISLGVAAILCLMATMHYFVVKSFYIEQLGPALAKFPSYFERPELGFARINYRAKILLYILVLVGSITWITTHLSIAGQIRSSCYQVDEYVAQRVREIGSNLESALERNENSAILNSGAIGILGDSKYAYLLDEAQNNLLEKVVAGDGGRHTTLEVPAVERSIMDKIPALAGKSPEQDEGFFRGLFFQPLVTRVTDRVYIAYAKREQYTVTVDPLGKSGRWRLVSIQPQTRSVAQLTTQMGPILAMFVVALILSLIFAQAMQREMTAPLTRIIDSSKQVESGDLSDPKPIVADDEVGVLAAHHLRMVHSIKNMVRQIGQAAESIETATEGIAERTDEMALGSQAQSVAVEETSAIIAQMNQTIASIAESVDTLASSAEESSASIVQMSATNDQVANSSENLSSGVENTTASIQEMSASVRQVAENVKSATGKTAEVAGSMRETREAVKQVDRMAEQTASVSEEVSRDSETGAAAVQSTIRGIEKIKETSRQAADVIERLSKRAREIGRILTVIEDVTEETNLLALNAAIIAAQAGEHGKGFAVVADEIKDLAERTQASTSEISEQILAVQKDARDAVSAVERGEGSIEEGVTLSGEAGQALLKIQESAKKSLDMARRISDSTREQSRQVDQVLNFFETMAGMIEQIHAATQDQTRGTEQIMLSSEKMKDIAIQVKKATREQAMGSRQITKAIEHITSIATYINNTQGEQRKAAQHVLSAITKISDIAHRNVKGVEKVSESVANLKVLADDFKAMLDTFRIEEQ
ncbi:MAG TPA: methyl-accepting chemotaxis protein [bacterium]|nr:methyl-accepting chemotaxis protein [bacterium]